MKHLRFLSLALLLLPSGVRAQAADTVWITVVDTAVTVTIPQPDTTLALPATYQVTAIVLDGGGNVLGPGEARLFWSSTDPAIATVDQSGLVTLVSEGGPAGVVVSATLIGGGGPDPPPSGSLLERGPGTNEPSGMAPIWELDVTQWDQDVLNPNEPIDFYGIRWHTPETSPERGAFFGMDDGTYQHMRFVWPTTPGQGVGRVALAEIIDATRWSEIYVRMVYRFDAGFDFHGSGAHKMIMWGPGNNTWILASTTMPGRYALGNVTGPDNVIMWRSGGNKGPPTDTWFETEFVATVNSVGAADGLWRVWIDDVLVDDFYPLGGGGTPGPLAVLDEVRYSNSNPPTFNFFQIGPYIGGSGDATRNTKSTIRFATLYISGR